MTGVGCLAVKQQKKQLLDYFEKLSVEDAQTLLSFAEFLAARSQPKCEQDEMVVNRIERPASESVIAAIKRLSKSYPMLNKDRMLSETSSLMAQHIMQGRLANEVIDELELIFERHYIVYTEQRD